MTEKKYSPPENLINPYVKNLDEFEIFNGVSKAIKILKEKNFLVIIIIVFYHVFTTDFGDILIYEMIIWLKEIHR